MAVIDSDPGTKVDINVTPMIDVLLVLLVTFFILNLPMPHILVQVPAPSGPVVDPPARQLVLILPENGGFELNGQPVPDGQLDAVLRNALEGRAAKLLFVGAGAGRRYQEVITAIDRAKGAGAEVVAFLPEGVAKR